MFKSSTDANTMSTTIDITEKELENTMILLDLIIIHLGDNVIP